MAKKSAFVDTLDKYLECKAEGYPTRWRFNSDDENDKNVKTYHRKLTKLRAKLVRMTQHLIDEEE